jgi:hypothetical protein
MSRQKKAGTISALLIGLLVLSVCLASLGTRVSAIARLQSATVTPTPTPCEGDIDDCNDYATDDAIDAMTASADALTATAAITPSAQTASTTTTPGVGTPTVTPTLTPTSLTTAATLAPSPIQPTPSIEPQRLEPTETPTAIPDSALICFPGQPLVITGDGPARAAFLVYFGQRVVSGGSVTPSGRFATTLIIGRERAGVYSITVRVRGTAKLLLETSCVVPDVTPTFVPRARELP